MTAISGQSTRPRRVRARVEGTVQGVGFRPFVYRLASEVGVSGFVFNDSCGVVVEAEANDEVLGTFVERLTADAPPLAIVERVTVDDVPCSGRHGFEIRASPSSGEPSALVSPDTATCSDCLAELFDPADRRYRYPFINCTNCGPRFTIVRGVPYDRPLTTMAAFELCAACRAEYEDPSDHRFHAQPNACPDCGPRLSVPLETVVDALLAGAVVAVKGLGGFHLACLADDESAVGALRARKHREDKPFALMVPSVEAAAELAFVTPEDEALLVSRERPIVLIRRRRTARVASSVAPLSPELGLMLPYSPLHHLLLADVGAPLVMTSGNVSDEPIAYRDEDALERLAGIADLFLVHDRPIETRTDDSVVRTVATGKARRPLLLRRSRGYVPASLALPLPAGRQVLACGAELKNTFCVAKGERAWVGHHIGDLQNYETLRSFSEGIEHFKRLFAVEPELVACDLHPEYLSTKYAHDLEGVELVGVQHHHAHLAACLAEHGETGPALGAIFDGTGYGTDGSVWGGELLTGDLTGFERVGHLFPVRMPGGEAAIRQPWRMACAWLVATFGAEPAVPSTLAGAVTADAWH
ncbi:MAG TPA: carbamoyltransferase HypF, partial [Thermoleophilaceae bacterium]